MNTKVYICGTVRGMRDQEEITGFFRYSAYSGHPAMEIRGQDCFGFLWLYFGSEVSLVRSDNRFHPVFFLALRSPDLRWGRTLRLGFQRSRMVVGRALG